MTRTICALTGGVALSVMAQATSAQAVAQAAGDSQGPVTVNEIVVTATKRTERMQSVPLSVSVVDSAQLARQNITNVADLTVSIPGLNSAGPYGALSIRGIGSESFSRSSEGSVGVVVDGVALAGTSANPPQMFDVARVEVLEGPQGTLFGSTSSAGVINIVTNVPDPSKFEAIGHVDIGTLDDYTVHGVVNIPIAGNAALRVSGSFDEAPNVLHDDYDDTWQRNYDLGGRARFLWQPTANITVNEIADFSQHTQNGGAPWSVYYSTPGSVLSTGLAACGVTVSSTNDAGCPLGGSSETVQTYGYSSQVDVRLGQYTLTSISAYRGLFLNDHASSVADLPLNLLAQGQYQRVNNVSQELRLASPTGGLVDYVVGLYYFDSELKGATTQFGPTESLYGVPYDLGQTLSTRASTADYAVFGQGAIHVTHALRVNLGARLGSDLVSARTTGALAPGAVAPIANIDGIAGKAVDKYVSYRVGVEYDLTRDVMAYATYAKGFKGSAVNDQAAGPGVPILVQPEIPHAGEVGFKSTLFEGRLGANLALFYAKTDNFQAQFFDPALAEFVFGNAPSLTTRGVEINLFGRPISGLTLNVGAIYDNAKYGAGYQVSCSQLQTAAQGCVPVFNAAGAPIGTATDAVGNRLVGAPEWKVTASGEYARHVANNLTGFLQIDLVYTSQINWDAAYDPIDTSAPATIVGGRIGVRTDDQHYGVSLFVRNLFDVYRPIARFATPLAAEELDSQSYSQIPGPESRRVIGVSLDARF